jgi:para-nitrobenzyl esterase
MSGPTVSTAQGKLAGTLAKDIAMFRGVPYAAPPLGALRWAPPAPPSAWTGTRDATKDGPAPPQLPSRLERVMGRVDFANGQGEDCLTLTIAAPWPAAGGKRAVMMFFHGGAWMSGAGSLSLYSGAELARFGDVVVVGVNYRLGALGYLHVPELPASGSGANYGLLDHVAALAWVRDNIAAFGGDPANVTIFGQSAGGGSIATLMEMPEAVKLFRRAILQSAAVMPHQTPEGARRVTDEVLKALGLDRARIAALRETPVAKLLDAQRAAMMAVAKPTDPTPVYRMVHDGKVLTTDPPAGVAAGSAKGIDVLIGTTRDEVHAFFIGNDAIANIDRAGMAGAIRAATRGSVPGRADAVVEAYAKRLPGATPPALFAALQTDATFRLPSLRFADAQSKHARTWLYRFDWQPMPDAPYGAAHCIELPFVFGNFADWDAAPVPPAMLKGGDRAAMTQLARQMMGAWMAFAKSGDPNHAGLPKWVPWSRADRRSLIFDADTRAATGLDDEIEAVWR